MQVKAWRYKTMISERCDSFKRIFLVAKNKKIKTDVSSQRGRNIFILKDPKKSV
jgi:hypothetical protein